MTASLPLPLIETLLIHSLERRPTRDDDGGPSIQKWLETLQVWRQTLTNLTADHHQAMAQNLVLWTEATKIIPGISLRKEDKRAGHWGDIPVLLQEEVNQWKKAGLISRQPHSTLELPALALTSMARTHAIRWDDMEERVMTVLENPAPAVMEELLDLAPELDLEPLLLKPSRHSGGSGARPWAHELFSSAYWDVSMVIRNRGRLPASLVYAKDYQGSSVLGGAWRDEAQIKEWLKLGADPNALDGQGRLPEETIGGQVTESVMAFHRTLQQYRTPEQAQRAHLRLAAHSLTSTPAASTQALGLFGEVMASPRIDMGNEHIGVLTYIERFSERSYSGRERLTTLSRLLTGRTRASWVLGAEGGHEKGLAVAMGLVAGASDNDWLDRNGPIEKAFKPLVDRSDREELIRHTLDRPHMNTPSALVRVLGVKGLIPGAIDCLSVAQWTSTLTRLSHTLGSWRALPSQSTDVRRWNQVLNAATQALEGHGDQVLDDSQKAAWMGGLMVLMLTENADHPAYQKVLEWAGEGVEPTWPDEEIKARVGKWVQQKFPAFGAARLERSLDKQLVHPDPTSAPRFRAARM